jgi:DNA (cytosine-5)-methyltransferase 1
MATCSTQPQGVYLALSVRSLRVAGLFSGIGGIEKGLEDAGHRTLMWCEKDPAAQAVLEEHSRAPHRAADVTKLSRLPDGTELLAAGFPCQDLSQAGRTAGIAGRNSSLVGHAFKLLKEAKERRESVEWVLLENVPFMLRLDGGRAIATIIRRLERLGYRWAYRTVDTRAFGLPHRRQRVFLLASRSGDPRTVLLADDRGPRETVSKSPRPACGFYWTEGNRGLGWTVDAIPTLKGGSAFGIPSPPAIWRRCGAIVMPGIEDAERLQGFEPGWTEPAESGSMKRSMRWRLVGNAVTVDVARWVGDRLREPGEYRSRDELLPTSSPWPEAAWNLECSPSTRHRAKASAWPVRRRGRSLDHFVKNPIPLSKRATAGFTARLERSSLRLEGLHRDGFLDGLHEHLRQVRSG